MSDQATIELWLAQARVARHKLVTGDLRATVTMSDGKSVTFVRADLEKLEAYIADLVSQLATLTGDSVGRRRPLHMSF